MTHPVFAPLDTFARRHLGSSPEEIREMLAQIGCASMRELVESTVPATIRRERPLSIDALF